MFSENLGREKRERKTEQRSKEQERENTRDMRKESGKGKTVGNHAQKVGVE